MLILDLDSGFVMIRPLFEPSAVRAVTIRGDLFLFRCLGCILSLLAPLFQKSDKGRLHLQSCHRRAKTFCRRTIQSRDQLRSAIL